MEVTINLVDWVIWVGVILIALWLVDRTLDIIKHLTPLLLWSSHVKNDR